MIYHLGCPYHPMLSSTETEVFAGVYLFVKTRSLFLLKPLLSIQSTFQPITSTSLNCLIVSDPFQIQQLLRWCTCEFPLGSHHMRLVRRSQFRSICHCFNNSSVPLSSIPKLLRLQLQDLYLQELFLAPRVTLVAPAECMSPFSSS